jgi:hypothetical protein
MKTYPPLESFWRGPCSSTGERGQWEETSEGDPDGDGDPDNSGGEVLASLGGGLPSAEGEHSYLLPLLSSIANKLRAGERSPKREKEECEVVPSGEWRRYLYPKWCHAAPVTGVVSFSTPAVNNDASRIVHHVPVIQTVKKMIQLFR